MSKLSYLFGYCCILMCKLLPMLALLASSLIQADDDGDLDAIIKSNKAGVTAGPQASTWGPNTVKNDDDDGKSCLMADGVKGECVFYFLCDKDYTIINDGASIYDTKLSSLQVRDGDCKSYFDTCCRLPDRKPLNDPTNPTPPAFANHLFHEGCGWRNPDGMGGHIHGADGKANFGEFPWMVAILAVEPTNDDEPDGQKHNIYVGGGSLIHPSVVLTAAHYVVNGNQMRVRAGEWDTQTKKELYPHQDRDVNEVVVHKDFNIGNLFNDIGLLFLSSPVDPAPNVGVACLPKPGVRATGGTRCLATGWGKDSFGKRGQYQVILKRMELLVVERARCQQELRKTRLGKYFELHSSFMCAGGEQDVDMCKGDGGSPLVCPTENEKDRYIQHGIVAWGVSCGEPIPAVYVDVGHFRAWIDQQVRSHGYYETTYTYIG